MQLNYRGQAYPLSNSIVERMEAKTQVQYRGQSYSLRGVIEPSKKPTAQRLRYRGISYEC
ncbi:MULTISPECIES: DUF4278 domain-containing protein [unclassified Leptolyngbya]|uniref:DUF4278 domain-containing protein n=1 Tax=unclassified Leptolyngbya TaxID=2650499 RepID=UPI00168779A0|nr:MULTISPECIES: DUF4278 domain-containing protein [unclassified Leptolyngbya]MBD1913420.1 DUF4278 domain-containing protein [Leptolyngbya sp. FACHB-8]MBD2155815.1 DUF4278 domain-containing protein [Leptolyngbya sp. FACHB-16]